MPLPESFSDVARVAELFLEFFRPWCICGGWALDLFVGRASRPHKDVDVAIWRPDQLAVQGYLTSRGWRLEKSVSGRLLPWAPGEWLDLPTHGIWCRNPDAQPDFVEILLNELADGRFAFRRRPGITRELSKAVRESGDGVRILAPEIVLLYKSTAAAPGSIHQQDFENTRPHLDFEQRNWLRGALAETNPGHTWLGRL